MPSDPEQEEEMMTFDKTNEGEEEEVGLKKSSLTLKKPTAALLEVKIYADISQKLLRIL